MDTKNNAMKGIQDNLLVPNKMKFSSIHKYVHTYLRTFLLGHPTDYIYHFFSDGT